MTSSLFERFQQAKAEKKAQYARDLAIYLSVSEGELLHCRVGIDGAKRLAVDAPTLLKALSQVGEIKAITRNDYAVHEHLGQYTNLRFNEHGALALNPRHLDLRFFFQQWDSVFALTESTKHGERHSIQFFDKNGDAIHKVYTTDKTNLPAWQTLITQYETTENPPLDTLDSAISQERSETTITDALKTKLDTQWREMTSVHQFFQMMREHKLNRQQIFRAVSDDLAYRVPKDSFRKLVETAFNDKNEIMIFVSNSGCVQIFTGIIEKCMPYQSEGSDLVWFNIFNPQFTLHMIENGIDECWVTRKPTDTGFVTSLELFDKKGQQIVQMYGERHEGHPEQSQWRKQITALSKIVD